MARLPFSISHPPLLFLILHSLTLPLSEQSLLPTPNALAANQPAKAAVAPDPIKDLLQQTDDPYKDSVVFVRAPEEFRDDPQFISGPLLAALPRCARCPYHSNLRSSRFYYNHKSSNSTSTPSTSWISYLFG
ncbi:hypothetical protein PMAYCL1PPCAC_07546 [Pristionchus mayeri]|uniref:Uncharacterized protein n=1 Tax=Pristionchus mayeri TaxID=1317129 RepID=A0AAN4ZB23_9BILA|nr:hypothetical protein PMAYCL1PPCAC_07546 [Pristionchus mayeri]